MFDGKFALLIIFLLLFAACQPAGVRRTPAPARPPEDATVGQAQLSASIESPGTEDERIVFVSTRDGNAEIYVMNVDGSGQTRLTYHESDDVEASWSPDGKQIVFVSARDGRRHLYTMNADGSQLSRLTDTPFSEHNPEWSPNGRYIAYDVYQEDSYRINIWMSKPGKYLS
jgi:TolB protein